LEDKAHENIGISKASTIPLPTLFEVEKGDYTIYLYPLGMKNHVKVDP